MSGAENETDKKSKLRAIQDWTTERIGDVRYMVNRCITSENREILNMEVDQMRICVCLLHCGV